MRNCGNCEWCITENEEKEEMIENNYDEEDLNRPLAGDCSLGINHYENYFSCKAHNYKEELTNIHIMYDENYLGPGYFIIMEYDKNPEVLIKMYISNSGTFPEFKLFAYEKNNYNFINEPYKNINLLVFNKNNEKLYKAIKLLSLSLPYDIVNSSIYNEENSNLNININEDFASINITKDISNEKENKEMIFLTLGDPYTCKNYIQMSTFYNRLAGLSKGTLSKDNITKILKKK